MSRRVVITGAGVVSPIGTGVDEFWRHCLQAKSVVEPIPEQWLQVCRSSIARVVSLALRSRVPRYYPDGTAAARSGCGARLGAAREAFQRAGFTLVPAGERSRAFVLPEVDSTRVGVYFGTGIGGAHSFLQNHVQHLYQRAHESLKAYSEEHALAEDAERLNGILALMAHPPRYHPFVVSMLMPNAASAAVGIKFSLTGPNVTYCVACASGTVAVGHGYRAVQEGRVDIAVSGRQRISLRRTWTHFSWFRCCRDFGAGLCGSGIGQSAF